jgi:phosphohistidine phosphatase
MRIFLVRHAAAIERDQPILTDVDRFLTADGRRRFRKVARCFAKAPGTTLDRLITSPLVRSVQTAELLAEALRFKGAIEVWPSLSPDNPAAGVMHRLGDLGARDRVALVGHEPQMSTLAGLLLRADFPFPFPKGGIARFERGSTGAAARKPAKLAWLLVPKGRRFVRPDGSPVESKE